jgi:hypothetical protein
LKCLQQQTSSEKKRKEWGGGEEKNRVSEIKIKKKKNKE